jgi:hypothetical protein
MVEEQQEFKGNTFEQITEVFLHWMPFDQAITTAWLFCHYSGAIELSIPKKQHDTEYAEYLVSKGYSDDDVMLVTGVSRMTICRIRTKHPLFCEK